MATSETPPGGEWRGGEKRSLRFLLFVRVNAKITPVATKEKYVASIDNDAWLVRAKKFPSARREYMREFVKRDEGRCDTISKR